jgi:hypothetical protein
MPKIVNEQMREATRQRIMRVAASEFARLVEAQANINVIAEQAGIGSTAAAPGAPLPRLRPPRRGGKRQFQCVHERSVRGQPRLPGGSHETAA